MNKPNILLVVLDSVRAKNTSLLGYQRETTPNLEKFAENATLYTNARSPGIHSISSHVSIFTGSHVAEHRATSHGASLRPGHTIWERLSNKGYRTGLFTPNAVVAESSNLASFFQTVEGPKRDVLVFPEAIGPEQVPGKPSYAGYLWACLRSDSPLKSIINGLSREFGESSAAHNPKKEHGGEYIQDFFDWMEPGSDPWAACVNLMDAHYPYIPLDQFDRWGGETLQDLHREAMGGPLTTQYLGERPFWELEASESLYDDCIRQADAYVGELIEYLKSAGEFEETLIVVTSDHGEGFGEYSVLNDEVRLIDHSWGIGEELAHVPLVVKYPTQSSGNFIDSPATLTRFSTVVEKAIDGEQVQFISRDGSAITTSYRIKEPGDNLPIHEDKREPYFGPWHAICRNQDGKVIVDAVRRGDQVQYSPSNSCQIGPADREYVESAIGKFSDANMTADKNELDNEVERRLHELGYMT